MATHPTRDDIDLLDGSFYVDDPHEKYTWMRENAPVYFDEKNGVWGIASYAALTMMIAQVCGLKLGDFVHTFGDTHLYMNHLEQAREQLSRQPRKLPTLRLNPTVKNLFDFKYEDFTLENYDPHPAIKAPVAV